MASILSSNHYLFDGVPLLDDCLEKLQLTIDRDTPSKQYALHDMKEALCIVERLLHAYLDNMIEKENQALTNSIPHDKNCNIQQAMRTFRLVLIEKQRQEELNCRKIQFLNPQDPLIFEADSNNKLYSNRSATDSLLFRLIVALQLCLVRIDDAHSVITGRRIQSQDEHQGRQEWQLSVAMGFSCGCCILGAGAALLSLTNRLNFSRFDLKPHVPRGVQGWSKTIASGGAIVWGGRMINELWKRLWVTDKIYKSTCEIDEWARQWQAIQKSVSPRSQRAQQRTETTTELLDDKSRRLIEYAMKNGRKSYFWQSQGEIRFLMLKRFMDVYYASVGTAIDSYSGSDSDSVWKVPLITGAAASFYSITGTGASIKASHVVNKQSRDLIQHAWGMVSLPAIKSLMLHSSRLLKGASVADRLDISGALCFVLSRDPAPELAAKLKRHRMRTGNNSPHLVNRMSTISETASEIPCPKFDVSQRRFAGSCGRYRQRDVILHLTGGGFFAHTIASDLPYLLDWSASTGAVVICPEYALLPDHTFPVALDQIMAVYKALVDGVDLGFEVNRIVVTGESAGGNLAAALCVKLGIQQSESRLQLDESIHSTDKVSSSQTVGGDPIKMPDGMMLSCAALNLSLEMSHSRVVGTEDPVLPSGLISAISDAYLPEGFSKKDPLASPFYAPNYVLQQFPPVLLFAGSNDPLLDDSVAFNERLRCCGVNSELRAAHNMPHAYWGLGTAGFPEAQQVQQECQEWLKRQFS